MSEKLDGSCVAIVREAGGLVAYGRDGVPCAASRNDGRRAFAAWVESEGVVGGAARSTWASGSCASGWRWCTARATRCRRARGGDRWLRRAAGRWLLDEVRRRAAVARVLHDGGALAVEDAVALLGEHGHHGAIDPAEGVVYRGERGGTVIGLAKHVCAGKLDGKYLANKTGGDHAWNTWEA